MPHTITWRDRLRGRQPAQQEPQAARMDDATIAAVLDAIQRGEIAVPVAMSNNAHDTQPPIGHELYRPEPGQGQGNGPAAKLGSAGDGRP